MKVITSDVLSCFIMSDRNYNNFLKNSFDNLAYFTFRIITIIEDIHNSWLYCFTKPFKFGLKVLNVL